MLLFIASLSTALAVSFICSLMEATLLSLTPAQIAELSSTSPRLGAIWRRFKADIERPIAVILLINTAAHTIGAMVAGSQFAQLYGDQWIWGFSLLFTFIMLQFTEIVPKTLGVHYNKSCARFIGPPLAATVWLLTPLLTLVRWLARPFTPKAEKAKATVDEISALASFAALSKEIGSCQERVIRGAARLSALKASEVMIPVEHVSFLSSSQSISEALVTAHTDAHTRFPICEAGNRNRVLGYVNFKEMIYFMRTNPKDPSLRGVIRPVHFEGPERSAADLLQDFTEHHIHMAIVRNPEGTTLGLVTLEDLLEELLGKQEDEFDRLPRNCHPLSGGMWLIGGGLGMEELGRVLLKALPDQKGNLSEWMLARLGAPPAPGARFELEGIEFGVRRVRRGRIFEAAVLLPSQKEK